MMRIHEPLLDFFMTLFALSSLVLWGVILSGGSFGAYAVLVLAAPLASGYLVMVNSRGQSSAAPAEPDAEHYRNRIEVGTIAIFVLLSFIFFSVSSLITILLLLGVLFLTLRQAAFCPPPFTPRSAPEKSAFMLTAALAIAVPYTLISHRPDADDALYLFFGLLPLDQPHQAIDQAMNPLLTHIGGHGRMLTSYPAIEAVVSYWTGVDFLQVHYLIVPAVAAMLSVLAYYGLFQRINGGHAALLTLMTVIILVLWGGQHRSPGNYAFVRLFQGKAMFYVVVCPYLVNLAIDVLNRRPGSKLRLAMASITGIGLTQSAIVLVPLFFAGMALATWLVYREPLKSGRHLPFAGGFALCLLLAGAMVVYLGDVPTAPPWGFDLRRSLHFSFGGGLLLRGDFSSLRGAFGIASIGLLPLLAQGAAKHKAVMAASVGVMLVVLNPITIFLVDQITGSLVYRLQWLLPVAGAAAAGIFLAADFISRGRAASAAFALHPWFDRIHHAWSDNVYNVSQLTS